ncbi:sugar ABC transporter ATP-binding protein [Leucobacter sp. OLJS4]|uniref:ABC transporter ATP-binding protein n=1 Tax=unclassified Leucobacter TaxID=2621730 RepID=UPI000C19789C|nr:ABC transporter ATP-binding protein [Leucobacter sp. OAMSW11]PII84194.1 sugar ABC transporter ATP-binding protein [Leucobacter sp. OLCALW19]PII92536.1 sugar ABC transporter ATP-binding protein [Leucobacter sp. OLAS13]PII95665.1 sugar ABC transporter ATP-binding protein [Leucobacter sp. OLTLW20]PII98871.1 sugar ABC transporter ATP-binding protein [Leucobacter sp. OLCS4]PII99828.1 sugar ABC transporter ATP-binding protein [Leucobacter sp. OLDS2]PIJ02696.1 sugar ABC transporter ATP-binding pr
MPRTSEVDPRPAIVLNDVRKTFKIKHTHSFKETFIASLRRKPLSSDFNALDGISISVPEGQSVALLGRNGSGKSTTLKLLSGVMSPDQGWVRTRGRIAGLLEVGAGFHPDLTGRENVYLNAAILGMSKEETDDRFDSILAFSEIGDFIDTEVKHYSSGMYSRLGFSVAIHTELDVLLVDEILSVGDAQFRQKCTTRMLELQDQGKTMFVVSHNASQVQQLCERGIVLEKGRMIFDGPIDEAVEFVKPRRDEDENHYPIVDGIYELYRKDPGRWGRPLGPQLEISENGGGFVQEFDKGMITSSTALASRLGAENATVGLGKGVFLAAYRKAGGPQGPWGFMVGAPRGILENYELRTMEFQNGTAGFAIEGGMRFDAN